MGPTRVRRTAKKSRYRRGGFDTSEAESATAAALEEKGKELRRSGANVAPDAPAVPVPAADVAAALQRRVPGTTEPAVNATKAATTSTDNGE
jgi:hypothetical protein